MGNLFALRVFVLRIRRESPLGRLQPELEARGFGRDGKKGAQMLDNAGIFSDIPIRVAAGVFPRKRRHGVTERTKSAGISRSGAGVAGGQLRHVVGRIIPVPTCFVDILVLCDGSEATRC